MKLNGNSHNGGEHSPSHAGQHDAEIEATEILSDGEEKKAGDAAPNKDAPRLSPKKRRLFIILGVVVLVILAAVVAYAIWEKPPEIVQPSNTGTPADTAATGRPDATGAPDDTTDDPSETEDPEDYGVAPSIAETSGRRDGVYTFLLAGVDYASSSTDTIMVVSFDTGKHTISCTSIPRDTMINIGWSNTPKKINAVYPGYNNSGQSGVEGLKTHVRNLLGFEVDSYVIVYLQAVEDAVDAIGGVWFDVPQDMVYWDPTQNLNINIRKGYQKLNGSDALKLCRFRNGYSGGDLQRIGVQHDFLKAMASQIISLGSVPHLGNLIDVLLEDVDTDLTSGNLAWLARQFLMCKSDDITFQTVPLAGSAAINNISFVSIAVSDWLEMVNSSINPYQDDVTTGNVNILTFSGGGTTISATTGVVAGGYDSFFCASCTVGHHAPGAHVTDAPAVPAQTETEPGAAEPGGTDSETEASGETDAGTEGEAPSEGETPEIVSPEPGEEPDITE